MIKGDGIAKASTVAMLDTVAETLERRGALALSAYVDTVAHLMRASADEGASSVEDEFGNSRREELDRAGFDEIMERDFEVADEIYRTRIPHFNWTDIY